MSSGESRGALSIRARAERGRERGKDWQARSKSRDPRSRARRIFNIFFSRNNAVVAPSSPTPSGCDYVCVYVCMCMCVCAERRRRRAPLTIPRGSFLFGKFIGGTEMFMGLCDILVCFFFLFGRDDWRCVIRANAK